MEKILKVGTIKSKTILGTIGALLLIMAIILMVCFFLIGQSTIDRLSYTEKTTITLTCASNEISYPFFDKNDTSIGEIKIKAIFSEDDEFESIMLSQITSYSHKEEAASSKATDSASLNEYLMEIPKTDRPKIDFYSDDYQMRFYIYADNTTYNKNIAKFFLIYNDNLWKLSDFEKNYISQGFSCTHNK